MPPTLLPLAGEHPGLRVEVTEAEPESALPALASGQYDLVLGEEYPGRPLPRSRETERLDLFTDELRLAVPTTWAERSVAGLAAHPFVLEPPGTTAHDWAVSLCRAAGFEPDARYRSTDLQIHLTLVTHGLAAALVPDLSGAAAHEGVTLHALPDSPARAVFASVRLGAAEHPTVRAFTTALTDAHHRLTRQER